MERRSFLRGLPPVRAGGAESPGAGLRDTNRLGHVHLPVFMLVQLRSLNEKQDFRRRYNRFVLG